MVVRPTAGSDTSVTLSTHTSHSSTTDTNMASSATEIPSWSKMYGQGDRRRTYQSKFSRVSTYDPVSSRFKTEPNLDSRQSRFDTYSNTTMTRSRVSSSVDRDTDHDSLYRKFGRSSGINVTGEDSRSLGRRAYSVDRDVGSDVGSYGSGTKVRPWREKLRQAEKKRRMSDQGELHTTLQRSYSHESSSSRTTSPRYDRRTSSPRRTRAEFEQSLETRYGTRYESDKSLESRFESATRKSRASSIARLGGDRSVDYESIIASAKKRAASVSRLDQEDDDYEVVPHRASSVASHRAASAASAAASAASAAGAEIVEYNGGTSSHHSATSLSHIEDHLQRGHDISSFVFRPGEKFEPEHMRVVDLPSGRKARTYSTFSQYGPGDHREANNKINEVSLKTKLLEQSVSTLEDFVRRNRSHFPEETTIYQQIRFYQLDEGQLREIGESPDAEVYGVKVREKLVVPHGTDVGHILAKYYKSSDVDVEYSSGGVKVTESASSSGVPSGVRRRLVGAEYETVSQEDVEHNIRRQVEAEFDMRDKKRCVGQESYEVRSATQAQLRQDQYNHLSSHVSPTYIHSVYRDAGANYDDIYQRSGASTLTSPTASVTSDIESIRSSASSRRRTYDQVPHFTAKLRNKQCTTGQTIKFNCSVSGLPFPDITWFKGNRVINPGGRFTFSNNYGLLSLEIQNVTKEDAGLYSIKAINTEGEVATSASLDVIELDMGGDRSGGTQKPYFIVEAANTAAEIGGRAIFEARAVGKPLPTFRWYRDNILVLDSGHVKQYEDQSGNTKLVISDVRREDAGLYFLTAESKAGKAKCAATLRVVEQGMLGDERRRSLSAEPGRRRSWSREVTPTLDLPPRQERGTKPYFIQVPPVELKVKEGESLTLKCMVDGDPKPVVHWTRGTADRKEEIAKVTWCKGVRELQYTERHRVVTEGDHYMMQIKATTAYDRGQYIVVAENAVGRIHANCWVNVLPFGDEDEGDDLEFKRFKLELPELELDAITKGDLGKQAPMFVKRLPRERTVSAGSSLEMHCHVREATPEVVTYTEYSTKAKGKLELQEETIKIAADGTVSKKTEVVGLESKPPRPQKAAPAAEAKAAAAEEANSAEAEAVAPVSDIKPSESEVPVEIQMEPEPEPAAEVKEVEVKEEPKAEVKLEAKPEEKAVPAPVEAKVESVEAAEEVIQPTIVEKPQKPPVEVKATSPEREPSPVSVPTKEPDPVVEAAPAVVEEAIAPVAAEKVKEVVLPKEESKPEAKPEEKVEEKSEEKVEAKTEEKVEAKPEEKVEAKPEEKVEAKPEEKVEAKPEEKVEAKPEEKVEAVPVEAAEEVIQPTIVEKPQPPPPEPKAPSPEHEPSPTPQVSAPEPTPVVEETAPVVVEEVIEAVAAEKVKEVVLPAEEVKTEKPAEAAPAEPAPAEPAAESAPTESAPAEPAPAEKPEDKPAAETPAAEPAPEAVPEPAAPAVAEAEAAPVAEVKLEAAPKATEEAAPEPLKVERSSSLDSQSSLPDAPSSPTTKELKSESEGGLPVFVEKLRNIMVPVGSTATFSCEFNSNSNASAAWTKDGEALSSSTNVTVSADGCTQTVTISDVTKADEGCYTCTATNANGTATTAGTLTVESLQKDDIALTSPADKPVEEPVAAKEETKPVEQEIAEETKETKTESSQPEDSDVSEDSESDSDSDDSSSEVSSDSESDSEEVPTQKQLKEANSRVAFIKTRGHMSPRLSALSHPRSVISSGRHISTDPLLETGWLCEGRQ